MNITMNDNTTELTHLLYFKDEVYCSLISGFLQKDFTYCEYWLMELFISYDYSSKSSYCAFNALWYLYFNFIFVNEDMSFNCLSYVYAQYLKYCNRISDIEKWKILRETLFQLCQTDISLYMFICFQTSENIDNAEFKYSIYKKCPDFIENDNFKCLKTAIYNNNWFNIILYLNHFKNNNDMLFNNLYSFALIINDDPCFVSSINLLHKIYKLPLLHVSLKHYICYTLCFIITHANMFVSKNILLCQPDDNTFCKFYFDDLNINLPQHVYKTLPCYRRFNVDDSLIGAFNSPCNKLSNKKKENILYNHWIYYASTSHVWKMRISSYKGIIDDCKRDIIFDDTNGSNQHNSSFESFYNKYNFEPDECIRINTIQPLCAYDFICKFCDVSSVGDPFMKSCIELFKKCDFVL